MTPSLHERVASAVELASRALEGPWKQDDDCYVFSKPLADADHEACMAAIRGTGPEVDHDRMDIAGICKLDQQHPYAGANANLIAASHDHVALIKELHAALLSSEEARGKAEVDAGRYRGLRYLAITVGDCSIFDKFKERCYDARAYDGEFDSDSDIAVLAMNSKSVWWRAKRDAAMKVTP